ncbi:protein kinase domain-containing protein [Streptomyces sp. SBT349]|uniref:protein kinase domain-containing protein n=1 Tax=Streptomyces sp. SBT349 TaxID=1580539 RepID=UPI00066B1491|nr:serine/threonine-protein kinase [Streptomyces sp. SBT349]
MNDIRTVLRLTEGDAAAEAELLGWATRTWERALRQIPVEAGAFRFELGRSWDTVIEDLHRWRQAFHARPEPDRLLGRPLVGHLGVLLVTLVSLRHSYARRFGTPGDGHPPGLACADLCVPTLQEPAVREALCALYAPGRSADLRAARAEWRRLDPTSLTFHRHGTTSFILQGRSVLVQGHRRQLALKCILLPYLRVPAISEATGSYMSRYGRQSTDMRHLAQVWASCGKWIMMKFVEGKTLAEYLGGQPPRPGLRTDLLGELGPKLFDALAELESEGLHHGDLSPSNIIVQEPTPGTRSLVLVDLGVNYLYSHAVSGSEGPDAGYVAPEIRNSGRESLRADVYSLGLLLVAIAGAPNGWPESTTLLPDELYAESPVLARLVEDLTAGEERNRLLIFRPDPGAPLFPQLARHFNEELEAVLAAREGRAEGPRDLLTPLNGAPRRAWRMWRIRRRQDIYRDGRGMYVRWLMFTSWVAASVFYTAGLIILYWWLRDIGWDWGNQPISVLQWATGSSEEEFPFLDALRQPTYPVEDFSGSLAVRLVAVSSLLAGIRHYQNVLAGITPLITGPGQGGLTARARCAEVAIRLWGVAAALACLPPTLVQRDWWPIALAAGVTCGFLCNFWCMSFSRTAIARARAEGLSTVPPGTIPGLRRLVKWTWTHVFYLCIVWVIGLLIVHGQLQDERMYAILVALINVDLYVRSCSGSTAVSVRAGLTRACLAAERLRYLPRTP